MQAFSDLEKFLLTHVAPQETLFHIKELNEQAEENGCRNVNPANIKTIINFWAIKNWIKRSHHDYSGNTFTATLTRPKEAFKRKLAKQHELAQFIVERLYEKSKKPFLK